MAVGARLSSWRWCPVRGLQRGKRLPRTDRHSTTPGTPPPTSVANIQEVAELELETLKARTPLERWTVVVAAAASSTAFTMAHLVWFGLWIGANTLTPWRFDPYPFSLLTLVVSLEAIVLTGFILRDQAYMELVSDRRAHLDLQVNLLAEQELTAIMRMLCGLAAHVGYDARADNPQLEELLQHTNVRELAARIKTELDPATDTPNDDAPEAAVPAGAQGQ